MKINTDKLVQILESDKPLNVTVVEEYGKDKLVVMFTLPHLLPQVHAFAKKLLEEQP